MNGDLSVSSSAQMELVEINEGMRLLLFSVMGNSIEFFGIIQRSVSLLKVFASYA